ncbi:hypothetical protein GCM10009116_03710 [Brevundimonas basaltis]
MTRRRAVICSQQRIPRPGENTALAGQPIAIFFFSAFGEVGIHKNFDGQWAVGKIVNRRHLAIELPSNPVMPAGIERVVIDN